MGNCGIGIAPVRPETREALLRDLEGVEGIPYDVMSKGIKWNWRSFTEYLNWIDQRGVALNVAALVSLTALRYATLGEEALFRPAADAELTKLVRQLEEAMDGGAIGFSTDHLKHHRGFQGRPLACQAADDVELASLCDVLNAGRRGTITLSLNSMLSGTKVIGDEDICLLQLLTSRSGRPVVWLPLLAKTGDPTFHEATLAKLGPLVEQAIPMTMPRPMVYLQTLQKPFKFGYYDSWCDALNATHDEKMALYRSATWRDLVASDMDNNPRRFAWERFRVVSTKNAKLQTLHGASIASIATDQKVRPLDALLDIVIEDDLETIFQLENANLDPDGIAWLMARPEFLLGLSDAGAHVDQLCDDGYATALLQIWVRERGVLTLEEAVMRLTSRPASVFGLQDRGVLALGYVADLVLFDLDRVAPTPPVFIHDLPGGAPRLFSRSEGIVASFVNGIQLVDEGKLIPVLPGRVLRGTKEVKL